MGGSEAPTILSEGNHFYPAGGPKQVTKRISDGGSSYGGPNRWNWKSVGDVFLGGSYFLQSGATSAASPLYAKAFSFTARPGSLVPQMTSGAGPLVCGSGRHCQLAPNTQFHQPNSSHPNNFPASYMHVVQLNLYIYDSLLWRRGTMVEEVDKLPPASRYEFSSTSTFFCRGCANEIAAHRSVLQFC